MYKPLNKKGVGLVPISNGAVRSPKAYNSLNRRPDSSDFGKLLGCRASVTFPKRGEQEQKRLAEGKVRDGNEENRVGNPCTLSNCDETVEGNFKPQCFHTISSRCISCFNCTNRKCKKSVSLAVPLTSVS